MQILEIGCGLMLRQGDCFDLPGSGSGELLILPDGMLRCETGTQTCTVGRGDALLLSRALPLHAAPAEGDLCYDFLLFDPASDRSFFEALQIPQQTPLHYADTEFLSVAMLRLCAEFYGSSPRRSDMTDCLLKAMLIRISETGIGMQASQSSADPRYAALVRLREKIYANPQERWSVDLLCAEVNMSRSYFQLIYRETFGLTCIADVINCKMNRARELLTTTSYTISHIAQLCGYDNEEHFMRQFKKNNGVTPTVFRREHT